MYFSVLMLSIFAVQEPTHQGSLFEELSPGNYNRVVVHLINLIDDEGLQAELEIVPSQVSEIKSRIKEAKEKNLERSKAALKIFDETGDQEEWRRTGGALLRDFVRELDAVQSDVLLPHQLEQLNQTVLWWMIKSDYGLMPQYSVTPLPAFRSVLEHQVVKEILEIDENQAGKLQKKSKDLQSEFVKEFTALHEKYEKRLREDLTSEQQRKMKIVLGETAPFLFTAPKTTPGLPLGKLKN